MQPRSDMESFGRVDDTLARLRRERDRLGPAARACVDLYLEEVEPCAEALERAARFAANLAPEVLDGIAESIAAFADEIASIVVERHSGDAELLPDIVALARIERESFADDVRRARARALAGSRARTVLDALAVSLTTVRRQTRRAA